MQPTPWVCAVSLGTWRRPRAVARQAQGRAAMWTVCFPLALSPEFLDFSPLPTPPRPPTHPASPTLCHQLPSLLTSRCYEPRPSFPPLARCTAALVLGPRLLLSEASRLWGHGGPASPYRPALGLPSHLSGRESTIPERSLPLPLPHPHPLTFSGFTRALFSSPRCRDWGSGGLSWRLSSGLHPTTCFSSSYSVNSVCLLCPHGVGGCAPGAPGP